MMVRTHNLGFPRIGRHRELKFALESFWRGESDAQSLHATAATLRSDNWRCQQQLDLLPVGDFSLYDQVLDTSLMLGNLPARTTADAPDLVRYFQAARGRARDSDEQGIAAAEMTKWFDTNYHYLVPEFTADTRFNAAPQALLQHIGEARRQGHAVKPVLLGPVTYLWLGKSKDGSDRLELLDSLLQAYAHILNALAAADVDWIQIDEPILATELDARWRHTLSQSCHVLSKSPLKLLLASYFGPLRENLLLACELPVDGLHVDAVSGREDVDSVIDWLPPQRVLSLGVINGRNIWKTDLAATLDWLEPLHARLGDRLWLAPSCSLLHVPVDLDAETGLDSELVSWLSFARQKVDELAVLAAALNKGRAHVADQLTRNAQAIHRRRHSTRVHNAAVSRRLEQLGDEIDQRASPYALRNRLQRAKLKLPLFPTTTIGSFPQTTEIRQARQRYRQGRLDEHAYRQAMQDHIRQCIDEQEQLGLDVLVHGEAERNDMVEYFGEQLDGFAFTRAGWVQSYGSRCVKPPVLFGDVQRPSAMTVDWIRHAQSLTDKPVKGMLTGPVTMLNWSFVRDDQPRSQTCLQLALALRDEVRDLEQAGTTIIQIDEAALREGLPLRRSDWQAYLDWAVFSFRVTAAAASDATQIHTHMCYAEFNDIIDAIAAMDADVITIETSRSDMELLEAFRAFDYPNEIGPGVYDIHSPNQPAAEQIVALIRQAATRIDPQRLWINPDCGLKTRQWREVRPALSAMVDAAQTLRAAFSG